VKIHVQVPSMEGAIFFVRKQCKEVVGTVDNCLVMAMFKVMDALLRKYQRTVHEEPLTPEEIESANVAALPLWLFSFVWSIGASVGAEGRKKLEQFTRAKADANGFAQHLPPKGDLAMSMYDFSYDQDELAWKDWISTVPKAKVGRSTC
jgi:dynein heavy chain